MSKVFFGKANDDRVIRDKSYRHREKDWFNGIDIGDYIFIKRQSQTAQFSGKKQAVVNYLWQATSWGETADGEHELFFQEIAYMNNQLPLGKFVALDMFVLSTELLNSTYKTVAGCIYPLEVLPGTESVLVSKESWSEYYNTNPIRRILFLGDSAEIDPNSRDFQLVVNNDDIATLQSAPFVPQKMRDVFIADALSTSAPKPRSAARSLYDLYHNGAKTVQWDDCSFVGFYDLFLTSQNTARQNNNARQDFMDYCKANGVPKAGNTYKAVLKKIETALNVDADEEFSNDECADMLSRISKTAGLDKGDSTAVLKKFIEFKKSLIVASVSAIPGSPFVLPICYKAQYSQCLLASKNIIFRGAPGTGKSYLAKATAADIVSNGTKTKYDELSEEEKKQIEFVQFHPSYDYSDFVEGLRPVVDESGNMSFKLYPGVFKQFVEKARKNYENSKKDSAELAVEYSVDKKLEDFLDNYISSGNFLTIMRGNKFVIDSYDEKYVNIYIPDNKKTANVRISLSDIKQLLISGQKFDTIKDIRIFFGRNYNLQQDSYVHSIYKAVSEVTTLDAIAPTQKEELKKYVFIIDEINRGEISKILGELFFSIDPGYRGKEGSVSTQYANLHPSEKFYIPENVYIIGTMNDIDRSVDTFDFAMRRRFRFVEIKADENISMLKDLGVRKDQAIARMKALNAQIAATPDLNENYQIGAAYFKKLEDPNLTFDQLWTDYLQPLLQDYINGMYEASNIMKDFEKAYGYKKATLLPESIAESTDGIDSDEESVTHED